MLGPRPVRVARSAVVVSFDHRQTDPLITPVVVYLSQSTGWSVVFQPRSVARDEDRDGGSTRYVVPSTPVEKTANPPSSPPSRAVASRFSPPALTTTDYCEPRVIMATRIVSPAVFSVQVFVASGARSAPKLKKVRVQSSIRSTIASSSVVLSATIRTYSSRPDPRSFDLSSESTW